MKRAELIIFRFVILGAACWMAVMTVAALANPINTSAFFYIGAVGSCGALAAYYGVRWCFTGRLRPWIPKG